MKAAADGGPLKGLLIYTEDPIVSSDIVKNPASSIVDSAAHRGHGRDDGQGRLLVRQRVGLLEPRRRPRAAAAVRTAVGTWATYEGKRVLVRVDFNVPLDDGGSPTTRGSARRCRRSRRCARGARALVLVSHLGRPKGREPGAVAAAGGRAPVASCIGAPVTLAPGRRRARRRQQLAAAMLRRRRGAAREHPLRAGRDQERPGAGAAARRARRRLRQRRVRRRAPRPRLDRGRRAPAARASRRPAAGARGRRRSAGCWRTRRGRWSRSSAAPRSPTRSG